MPIFIALWGLLFFLAVEAFVFLPLYLFGIPVSYLASKFAVRCYKPSLMDPSRPVLSYYSEVLDWWVGNYEDGIKPVFDWWGEEKTVLDWFLRNPVTNLRFTRFISSLPSPQTRSVGSLNMIPPRSYPGWFLAWSGPYVGFFWQNKKVGIWIGFKVNPRDARVIYAEDYRTKGLGTALQIWYN